MRGVSHRCRLTSAGAIGAAALLVAGGGQAAAAVPSSVQAKLASQAAAPVSQLKLINTVDSFGTTFYRFQQKVGGIPVAGGETVVADGPGSAGDYVADSSQSKVTPQAPASVSAGSAIAAAESTTHSTAQRATPQASLEILPTAQGGRLVWKVLLASQEPYADFQVLVDAHTGAVTSVNDLLENRDAPAKLFDPDPVKTQGSFDGILNNHDQDSDRLTALRVPVTLTELDNSSCLIGRWARVVLPTVPTQEGRDYGNGDPENPAPPENICQSATPGGVTGPFIVRSDFTSVTRSDRAFDALMGYFHITRTQQFIELLGFSNAHRNGIWDKRLKINVDYRSDDNSDFSGATNDLTLGIGGVPDGQDSEVFVHEYGHAVQHDQSHGEFNSGLFEAGAIGEGFSDYFAASVMKHFRPQGGTLSRRGQTAPTEACWSPFDNLGNLGGSPNDVSPNGINESGPCERRVDETRTPLQLATRGPHDGSSPSGRACAQDVHCIGEAWSGALWAINNRLGNDKTTRMVLQSQFAYTAKTKFNGASLALLAADRQLFGGRDVGFIRTLMCKRELLRTGCKSSGRRPSRRPHRRGHRRPRRARFTG